jgi:hypothetical protein
MNVSVLEAACKQVKQQRVCGSSMASEALKPAALLMVSSPTTCRQFAAHG